MTAVTICTVGDMIEMIVRLLLPAVDLTRRYVLVVEVIRLDVRAGIGQ